MQDIAAKTIYDMDGNICLISCETVHIRGVMILSRQCIYTYMVMSGI